MDSDKKICGEFVLDGTRTIYSSLTEDKIPERIRSNLIYGEKEQRIVFRFITMIEIGERHIYVPIALSVIKGLNREEFERFLVTLFSVFVEEFKIERGRN